MSLLYNPVEPFPIEGLGIETLKLPSQVDSVLQGRINATIYYACFFALTQGHRPLLPLVAAWSKAVCGSHLAFADGHNWSATFKSILTDEILGRNGMGAVVPVLNGEGRFEALRVVADMPGSLDHEPCSGFHKYLMDTVQSPCKETMLLVSGCIAAASTLVNELSKRIDPGHPVNSSPLKDPLWGVRGFFGNHYDNLTHMVERAVAIAHENPAIADVWDACAEAMCPASEVALRRVVDSDPVARRDRRTRSGEVPDAVRELRNTHSSRPLREALAHVAEWLDSQVYGAEHLKSVLSVSAGKVAGQYEGYYPVTFMTKPVYEMFQADGRTKTIWDLDREGLLEKSWHYKFSDVPLAGREHTDRRIYGERGENVVYGALIHEGMPDQREALSRMYGRVAVVWDKAVLRHASLCINDSSQSPWVVPATADNMAKAMIAMMVPRLMSVMNPTEHKTMQHLCGILTGQNLSINFIEVQIHSQLTPSDIKDVYDYT